VGAACLPGQQAGWLPAGPDDDDPPPCCRRPPSAMLAMVAMQSIADLTGFDPSTFWAAVTQDATPEAGAAERCPPNTRRTFDLLFRLGASHKGRRQLADAFQLCDPLDSQENVTALAYWIQVGMLLLGTAGTARDRCELHLPSPAGPACYATLMPLCHLLPCPRHTGGIRQLRDGKLPLPQQLHCGQRGSAAAGLADARGLPPPGGKAQV
jgi:hypothetical protein